MPESESGAERVTSEWTPLLPRLKRQVAERKEGTTEEQQIAASSSKSILRFSKVRQDILGVK